MKTQSIGELVKSRNYNSEKTSLTRGAVYRCLINGSKHELVRPLRFVTKHADYHDCELWEVRLLNKKKRKHLWLDISENG